jgi:uncharacterized Zn-binding protein involved in type VI secretion
MAERIVVFVPFASIGYPAARAWCREPASGTDHSPFQSFARVVPCRIKTGSRKVFVEGHGAAYLGVMVAHNNTANSNMPVGNHVHASQTKVFFGP